MKFQTCLWLQNVYPEAQGQYVYSSLTQRLLRKTSVKCFSESISMGSHKVFWLDLQLKMSFFTFFKRLNYQVMLQNVTRLYVQNVIVVCVSYLSAPLKQRHYVSSNSNNTHFLFILIPIVDLSPLLAFCVGKVECIELDRGTVPPPHTPTCPSLLTGSPAQSLHQDG